jgi:hypothetical protein
MFGRAGNFAARSVREGAVFPFPQGPFPAGCADIL